MVTAHSFILTLPQLGRSIFVKFGLNRNSSLRKVIRGYNPKVTGPNNKIIVTDKYI